MQGDCEVIVLLQFLYRFSANTRFSVRFHYGPHNFSHTSAVRKVQNRGLFLGNQKQGPQRYLEFVFSIWVSVVVLRTVDILFGPAPQSTHEGHSVGPRRPASLSSYSLTGKTKVLVLHLTWRAVLDCCVTEGRRTTPNCEVYVSGVTIHCASCLLYSDSVIVQQKGLSVIYSNSSSSSNDCGQIRRQWKGIKRQGKESDEERGLKKDGYKDEEEDNNESTKIEKEGKE